nr:hypothetical protein Iba_chr05eCG16850 [Ipomoea batatas]
MVKWEEKINAKGLFLSSILLYMLHRSFYLLYTDPHRPSVFPACTQSAQSPFHGWLKGSRKSMKFQRFTPVTKFHKIQSNTANMANHSSYSLV